MQTSIRSVFMLMLILGFYTPFTTQPARAQEKAVFAFDWIPIAKHSGFYVALDRGFYKENGLSVTLQRGFGSGDTIKRVATRTADFGFADVGSLIVAISKGAKAKAVGMFHAKNVMGVFFLKKAGFKGPKDLEGRTIGDTAGGAARIIFPAFAAANGIQVSKMEWITMTPAAKVPSLVSGKVDSISSFILDLPTMQSVAGKAGAEVQYFLYADHGVDIYANGVLANHEDIENKPDGVGRFVRATYKGVAWAVEHPDRAVETFLKFNQNADPGLTRAEWTIAVDHLITDHAKRYGIGHMNAEKMKRTRDIIAKYMKLQRNVEVEEIYTNQFLPKLIPATR